ncbi:hypothetical protein N7474_003214 [Penicillium riverlandense]|uniref:uncharacterized protein n=1 Tax=Penicillium riverlandense TaxID=1903569 RepID=UPI0025479293|nr:uncharacterized protein N7474_003214 [Penicillium riverlandense]KAJ5826076.1 hypothetical protein N7474_003214 [Penicillium riverlandense]
MASTSHSGVNYGAQVGINYGTFTADFHLPPGKSGTEPNKERSETPPSPLSTVPFARDPDFVSRDSLLNQIRDKSLVLGSRIALVGLGGVGKSQLAIEYSYLVRSQAPATWVFWVHASNATRFEQSFRDIADQVKIPGRHDPHANIFKLVENWLRDEKRGSWVLILDNVDDDEFLRKSPATGPGDPKNSLLNASTKPLLEYLPRSLNGFVIITSRTREVALKMVDYKDLIEVKPMERSEALELLQRKLEQPGDSQESRQLVEELELIPLAIVQAASYIRNRAPRCSVSQYLRDFQNSDREATKLLKTEAGDLYRDWEAKNSILVTWQISFDHIRQRKPSAVDLLSLMSFFDRQGIPAGLLRVQPENNHMSRSELLDDSSDDGEVSESDTFDDFEDDITTLRDFSFISVSKNGVFFTMHRLVQLTTRMWLKSHGQTERWKERFISNLSYKFPTGEYENWEICRLLFPHVKAAISERPKSQESLRNWATLLYNSAWYALWSGILADGKDMALKSRKQRVILLGEEHEEALDSTTMLARAWSLQGHWEEAEKLEVQVMKTSKTKLGADHPSTLMSMASLASTYRNQGRWEEAEQLQAQVMNTRKRKLGADHPDTLTSMSDLASTYRDQGRWEEAEQIQVQVMEMTKTKLGVDYPDTLTSMANLASTYREQGRWEEAEQLEVQAMKTSKTKLGKDHAHTLTIMTNLAATYWNQGRWEEAEQLQVQVMEMSKTILGVDHPFTLTSMANLASTYREQGWWEAAEQLEVQVMKTRKTKLGADHPSTLTIMANLAATYREQGRWEEAEQLLVQVMERSKTRLGEDHPDTLTSIANLAWTYWNQGRWEEAEQLQVQVMEMSKTKLGAAHPSTLTSMANLAAIHRKQGRWEEAEQLQVQVMEMSKTKLGANHPNTLQSMVNHG